VGARHLEKPLGGSGGTMARTDASLGIGGAVLLVVLGVGSLSAQDDTLEWGQELSAGDVLEVKNITGDIRVGMARGSLAEVVAEKRGRESDFDRIDIRIEQNRDGFTICAVYDRRDWEGCRQRDDGDRDDDDDREIRASVEFQVRLPVGVEFVGSTVTGDVTVQNVESDVTARTVTGEIEVSTTEMVRARNVSGSIDIEMGSTDWDDLSFKTVSGDITLRLPAGIDTDVEFESLSGDLDSDFDLTLRDRARRGFIGSRVRGTIGDGGRSLSLKTVSGNVRLLALRS
jgi:hypothetical protein